MALVKLIGQTMLPPGPGSTEGAGDIPEGSNSAVLTINKVGWPGAGDTAGWFRIFYTTDRGATWRLMMQWDFMDHPDDGETLVFAGSILDPNVDRRLRVEWDLLKGLTFAGRLDAYIVPSAV